MNEISSPIRFKLHSAHSSGQAHKGQIVVRGFVRSEDLVRELEDELASRPKKAHIEEGSVELDPNDAIVDSFAHIVFDKLIDVAMEDIELDVEPELSLASHHPVVAVIHSPDVFEVNMIVYNDPAQPLFLNYN